MAYTGKKKCKYGWCPPYIPEEELWNYEPHYRCDRCGWERPENFGFYKTYEGEDYCEQCAYLLGNIDEEQFLGEPENEPKIFVAVSPEQKVFKCQNGYPPFHPKGSEMDRVRKRTRTQEFFSRKKEVLSRDNNTCQNCGSKKDLQIDHITPISRGGSNEKSNLQVLCRDCNLSKRDKKPSEWTGR